jgi:hypothetical protein
MYVGHLVDLLLLVGLVSEYFFVEFDPGMEEQMDEQLLMLFLNLHHMHVE